MTPCSREQVPERTRFNQLLAHLAETDDHRYTLAELNDFLSALAPTKMRDAVAHADLAALSPFLSNYVAAMVEQASHLKGVPAPRWTTLIPPLDVPWFASSLPRLRLHLLRSAPVPFKRRNLFIDASIGARV